ncbi:hypothetical protein BHE74_00006200 [Ensete ventricosum]|nr:hypothetical protein BHE74_00006200 [Ensete ventricosum]
MQLDRWSRSVWQRPPSPPCRKNLVYPPLHGVKLRLNRVLLGIGGLGLGLQPAGFGCDLTSKPCSTTGRCGVHRLSLPMEEVLERHGVDSPVEL